MPIEVGLWRMDEKPKRVEFTKMETELRLEEIIAADVTILDPNLMIIGRQVPTPYGKFIDLLAIDIEGNISVFELKKDKTPRDVVAQLLDYGSWINSIDETEIASIYESYLVKYMPSLQTKSLDQSFCEKFSLNEMPEKLNETHNLIIVAAQLDDSSERIINYLTVVTANS